MPGISGIDLVERLKREYPHIPIIIMTAFSDLETTVSSLQKGAYEYLTKPFDIDNVISIVKNACENNSLDYKKTPLNDTKELPKIIGLSESMQFIYKSIGKISRTDVEVLILGETGTGKELIAKAIHENSSRKHQPFIAINTGAIPTELLESELFGHEKGSFTGAYSQRIGRFEQASDGTLFLDEIGDMPVEAQTRLLRVLQDGCFTAVGGKEVIQTNVRIVTATHRDLSQMIHDGLFREDLYYRLNVVPINIPSLRERPDDITLLINHFIKKYTDINEDKKNISIEALNELKKYHWPGNVRELENLIKRLIILVPQNIIDMETIIPLLSKFNNENNKYLNNSLGASVEKHLKQYFDSHKNELPANGLYDRIIHEVERPLIIKTLDLVKGNQLKAAELLGINRNTLRKKIIYLDIQLGTNNANN